MSGAAGRRGRAALIGLAVACIGVELLLQGAEAGARARWAAARIAGLRTDLLEGAEAVYPGQRLAMLVTYAFVHNGPVHLAGNLAVLGWVCLGPLPRLIGARGVLAIWLASSVAGGAAFLLLAGPGTVAVGASGAGIGLLGAHILRRPRGGSTAARIGLAALALLGVEVVSAVSLGIAQAWQVHLGGFLAGSILGHRIEERARR